MADAGNREQPWGDDVAGVLESLAVDPQSGLDDDEVLRRRRRFGPNALQAAPRRHVLSILVAQFRSIVILLLVAAAGLALAFGDFAEAVAIGAVILINAAIGFVSEWRATRSMEALRRFTRASSVVMRDGNLRRVDAEELVPGDILHLEAGDLVPADARLIEASKLGVNESTLTGESLPARKQTDRLPPETTLLERSNMVFRGTAITRGAARAVTTETGMRTEVGRIFREVSSAETPRTPLEKRLTALGGRLAWVVIGLGIALALGGILAGRDMLLAIQVAIALSVAAIPEGLPIVATIALARGIWRMARRNALITRLSAVETLGATSVILTDKTGTLTENRMTVTTVLLADGDRDIAASTAKEDELLQRMLATATLCNNAALPDHDGTGALALGDPTEVALLVAAARHGIRRETLLAASPEVYEDAFDPDSKRMATIHGGGTDFLVAVKGAPEVVLASCRTVHTASGIVPLDDAARARWLSRVAALGQRGLRTLAVADKSGNRHDVDPYSDLVLYGVVGLEDPARAGVAAAIDRCRQAGIVVVMVTGDHADTARNIALETGIADADSGDMQYLDGAGIDELIAAGRSDCLAGARVVSRVTPEQKLTLIKRFQERGYVVAMTGDGVNDAPALKRADIGVAMGQRGTEVAKEAASMVLQDDDFGTIVAAIDQGRTIFANIRKFVVYLLSCNLSEILIVGLATLAGAPLPLLPLQILFLNLVTDVFPALALGVGPGDDGSMQRGPRPADEKILMRRHWMQITSHACVMALSVLAAMAVSAVALGNSREESVTVAFLTLALAQLWHVFNMRADVLSPLRNEITRNPWVWTALALCISLIGLAIYVEPLARVMQLTTPDGAAWVVVVVGSLLPLLTGPLVRRFSGPGTTGATG